MYYVYVICDVDGNLYVGYSSDLKSGQAKRYLKDRIKNSHTLGIIELGARLKAPSRSGG
jgi:predicted GIY-YIG superfamily endonuclease